MEPGRQARGKGGTVLGKGRALPSRPEPISASPAPRPSGPGSCARNGGCGSGFSGQQNDAGPKPPRGIQRRILGAGEKKGSAIDGRQCAAGRGGSAPSLPTAADARRAPWGSCCGPCPPAPVPRCRAAPHPGAAARTRPPTNTDAQRSEGGHSRARHFVHEFFSPAFDWQKGQVKTIQCRREKWAE